MSKKKANMQRKGLSLGQAAQVLQEHDAVVHINAYKKGVIDSYRYQEEILVPFQESLADVFMLIAEISTALTFPSPQWIKEAVKGRSEGIAAYNQNLLNRLKALREHNDVSEEDEGVRDVIYLSDQLALLANSLGDIENADVKSSKLGRAITEAREAAKPISGEFFKQLLNIDKKYGRRVADKNDAIGRICKLVNQWRTEEGLSFGDALDRLHNKYYEGRDLTKAEEEEQIQASEWASEHSLRSTYRGRGYKD